MEDWIALDAEPDTYDAEDPEGDELEKELDRIPVGEFDAESDSCALPGGNWNTIPFGKPADCLPRLIVVIDSDANVVPMLRKALAHLGHCDGTCGVKTTSVMFYLTDFFPSWQSEWIAHRGALEAALGPQQMGLPPIIRISVRGRPQLTFFTSEGRPAGGRLMLDCWREADLYRRGHLRKRLEFVSASGVEQARNCSLIVGYSKDQPQGLNNQEVLSFGNYRPADCTIQQWVLRCYLVRGVPIGFAGRIKLHHPLPHPLPLHGPPHLPGGNSDAWVAVHARPFLITPGDYIDLGRLP